MPTKSKKIIDLNKMPHWFNSSAMFILLVSFAIMMGFAFSTTNDFTRRPLANFSGIGLAILFVGYPLVYAMIVHMDKMKR